VLAGNLDRPGEPARASVMTVLSVGSRGSLEAAQAKGRQDVPPFS